MKSTQNSLIVYKTRYSFISKRVFITQVHIFVYHRVKISQATKLGSYSCVYTLSIQI